MGESSGDGGTGRSAGSFPTLEVPGFTVKDQQGTVVGLAKRCQSSGTQEPAPSVASPARSPSARVVRPLFSAYINWVGSST